MRVRTLGLAALVVFLVVGCSDHNQGTLTPENDGPGLVGDLSGETTVSPFPVWPELTNGDFESGTLELGWLRDGTQNYTVSRITVGGNYVARLQTGEGPIGDADCVDSQFANFAFLDQFFKMPMNHSIECDFLVPILGLPDPTENATCAGFDRIGLVFLVVNYEPGGSYQQLALGVISITYSATSDQVTGHMQVNDFVLGTVISTDFDPGDGAPVELGPLAIRASEAISGWTHASMAVDQQYFPWLSNLNTCRVSVRNEDNRRTGRDFEVFVDNYHATPLGTTRYLDIRPGVCPNAFNPRSKGKLPVAILGSQELDVHEIDVSTIHIHGLQPEKIHTEDVSAPFEYYSECACVESGPDGYDDLVLKFSVPTLAEIMGYVAPGESTTLTVEGVFLDGAPFEFSDCVAVVGGRRPATKEGFN